MIASARKHYQNFSMAPRLALMGFILPSLLLPVVQYVALSPISKSAFDRFFPLMFPVFVLIPQVLFYMGFSHMGGFYSIIWRSGLLGSIFSLSLVYSFHIPVHWIAFFLFLGTVSLFHFSEFLTIALTKPKSLKIEAFMLNHSVAYHTAMITAIGEYFIEIYFSKEVKSQFICIIIGLSMCLTGEFLRKMAMLTAASNFDHTIQTRKSQDHFLVTHGIYSWSRHPAYVGWYLWAIGTQVLLQNPVSFLVYLVVTWKFFQERIREEEILLIQFFGLQYIEYQNKVPIRIPFISGFVTES